MFILKIYLLFIFFELTVSRIVTKHFELSVVHFNDFHSRFEQTNPSGGICKDATQCIGGFSRMYKQVMAMLDENPKSIFLNGGDSFQGTLWYSIGRWNVTQQFMNKLPIDAETLGNHDFEHGIQGVVPYIKALKHPIVVSNIDDTLEPDLHGIYNRSIVIEREGKKIGIIGVVTAAYPELADTGKLKFYDESASINAEAERLVKEEGVFTNIILSHCGYDKDKKLAANASEKISLIVGAHSHTFLWTGDNPPGPEEVQGPYPTIIESKYRHKVLVTQASAYCRYLGNITIFLDENGEISDYSGAPIFLDTDFPQDEQVNAELQPWKEIIDNQGKEVLGSTLVTLSNTGCNHRECTLGNFVTDVMVYAYTNSTSEVAWTEAAIAIMNTGGLRTALEIGEITYADLTTSQPFGNTFDYGTLAGRDIKDLLEFTVENSDNLDILQVSGINVVYDLSREVGKRVVSIKIRCHNCTIPVYEELDLNKDYPIVVCSFIRSGGAGTFNIVKDRLKNVKIGKLDIDVISEFLKRKSPVFQEESGRFIVR